MWNWEKGWECSQTFEGHSHYVMQVVFNPKDTSIFASASLDATVKVFMASIFQADFRAKSCSSDFLINSCRFGILILLLLLLH
jgi:coatomer subunit beta'